ncbi:alpha/beta fold hydrolase [Gluconobacter sp. Gdi]|uniref:alpha/beta fold hydrolase n=1 Tax=Gluconobacter sp. Gdi TaxID=2691888 RepID=UPI001761C8B0|nr:alpha/beta hydrolase [Gluconobacter sp. Gdi]GFE97967.1 alpha/beta hydrolase [Gluconobacter sp. Gdi]
MSVGLNQRRRTLTMDFYLGFVAALLLGLLSTQKAHAGQQLPPNFHSEDQTVDGVHLHYVEGGSGPPVLLIPGWLQTWYAWRKVMPLLAQAGHHVIAVDPPGMGSSDRPLDGYDTGTVGTRLDHMMKKIGYSHYAVMGHDIGMWIGYAMAADHPDSVSRLILVEAIIPGLLKHEPEVFMSQSQSAFFWQFMFNQQPELPEMLLKGREKPFMAYLFRHWAAHPERIALDAYARVYRSTDAIRPQMAYYRAFPKTIADNKLRAQSRLPMPVLALGGDHGVADFPREMKTPVTTKLSSGLLKDCGHFAPDECPEEIGRQVIPFIQ